MLPDTPLPPTCLNCGHAFGGDAGAPRPKFCPACGQETQVRPPTLREFAQQFGGAYFSTEGALWRTLKLLLLKPGELTAQYLAGRRKHYVLPLRLYLTISLLVLLLLRLTAGGNVEIKPDAAATMAQENKGISMHLGQGRAGMRDGKFYCEELPQWVCKRIQRRVDIDPKAIVTELSAAKERFMSNLGGAMFLLLPGFALWLKLAYLNRRLQYTEHLVFALHVHAFWFLALALVMTGVDLLSFVAVLAVPVYGWMALKRVYGGRWWPRLARAALVSLLYAITLALALTAVGLWTLLA